MTTFTIKIIAIVFMVIDHTGLFFFPQQSILRVIGRIAFPLFAWLIANGAVHTKSITKYIKRLLIFAILAQIPYYFANRLIDPSFWRLNVLFTLFLGLLVIIVIKSTSNKLLRFIALVSCMILADICKADYGAFGVLSISAFYSFYNKMRLLIASQIIICLVLPITVFFIERQVNLTLSPYYSDSFIEPIGLLSLFFIAGYNHQEGKKATYLFYYFYPLQYVVYFLIKLFVQP